MPMDKLHGAQFLSLPRKYSTRQTLTKQTSHSLSPAKHTYRWSIQLNITSHKDQKKNEGWGGKRKK